MTPAGTKTAATKPTTTQGQRKTALMMMTLHTRDRRRLLGRLPRAAAATVAWTLGLILVFRGALGSVWSLLDVLDVTPDYLGATHMTVQVGVCVCAAGVALVLLANGARNAVPAGHRIWELPILAGFSI